eukprot:m51a1_g8122 hypothetical protein (316) ;mRNA; f:181836-183093
MALPALASLLSELENETSWSSDVASAAATSSMTSLSSSGGEEGSAALRTLSAVCGWAYFAAWSLSFYPQVVDNFRRRSVVGLSFDFLLINVTGTIRSDYFARHPTAKSIPVKLNDVFFALHGFTLTSITILQCFFFERAGQRPSVPAVAGVAVGWAVAGVFAVLGAAGAVGWLDVVNVLSYEKLAVTATKYLPQAYLNYRRRCTKGWSVGNVALDMTGGLLSFAQMLVDGINYGNWMDFWGDPVKWGLSVLTLGFDSFFLVQHYCLYSHNREPERRRGEYRPLLAGDVEQQQQQQQSQGYDSMGAYPQSPSPLNA